MARLGILHLVACTAFVATSQAAVISYTTTLNGANESPANLSTGTGTALVDYDEVLRTMRVQVSFSNLVGTVTASHIHSPTAVPLTGTAGVATMLPTFAGFPSGVQSGTYDGTFDLTLASSWSASYVTANGGLPDAETAFLASLAAGTAYLNIHSTVYPGGEIRGFLTPVPEPTALPLLGFAAMALTRRWGR